MTKKASLYFDSFLMFYKNTLFDEWSIGNLQLCVKKNSAALRPIRSSHLSFSKSGWISILILYVNMKPLVRPRGLSALSSRPKGSRQVIGNGGSWEVE